MGLGSKLEFGLSFSETVIEGRNYIDFPMICFSCYLCTEFVGSYPEYEQATRPT